MGEMPALSRKMAMLRYMDIRLYAMVLCLILGLTGALSGFLLERAAAQNYDEELASPVLFDISEPERYSYVRLQYLTDSFVEHIKSGKRYYFGFDFMFRPYIISLKGELPDHLKELMEYTYSDGLEEPPAPVDVCGFGEPIQSELMGYARESYSLMWEETQIPMTMEEMSEIVGSFYLDAVPRTFFEQYPLGLLFYVVPAVLLAGAGVCGILYGRRLMAQNRRLAGRQGELAQADRELADAGEYVKGMKVYLTEHFIISASYQFEAVPYVRLRQAEYSSGMVIGVTGDGFAHILAAGRKSRAYGAMLAGEINRRMEMCGCPPEPASEDKEKIIE